jgi:hypothetical protein
MIFRKLGRVAGANDIRVAVAQNYFNVLSFLVLTALAKKESRAEGWILSRRPVKDDIPT